MSRRMKQYIHAEFKADNTVKVEYKNLSHGECVIAAYAILCGLAGEVAHEERDAFRLDVLGELNYILKHGEMLNRDEVKPEESIEELRKELNDFADSVN